MFGSVDVAQARKVLEPERVALKVTVSPRSNVPPPETEPRVSMFGFAWITMSCVSDSSIRVIR